MYCSPLAPPPSHFIQCRQKQPADQHSNSPGDGSILFKFHRQPFLSQWKAAHLLFYIIDNSYPGTKGSSFPTPSSFYLPSNAFTVFQWVTDSLANPTSDTTVLWEVVLQITSRFSDFFGGLTRCSMQLYSQPRFITAKEYKAKSANKGTWGQSPEEARHKFLRVLTPQSQTGCA